MVYMYRMKDCIVGLILNLFFFYFYLFSFFLIHILTLKVCVRVFLGSIKARILKFGIYTDKKLLYRGIANQAHCCYASLY